MNRDNISLKPCPFCGFQVDRYGLDDVFYPSGLFWRGCDEDEFGINRQYFSSKERISGDNTCYNIICNETMGGCGASVEGDTIEETAEKWNRRTPK